MRKFKNRLLAMALAVTLGLSSFSVGVSAEEVTPATESATETMTESAGDETAVVTESAVETTFESDVESTE